MVLNYKNDLLDFGGYKKYSKKSKILIYLYGNRSDPNIVDIKVVTRNHTKQIQKTVFENLLN